MPSSYTIDKDRELVTSTGWGVLTAAEVMEHQEWLASDKDFHPDFYQLLDLTAVTNIEIDSGMM